MAIIEQMNRDQQSALKLLSKDLDLRCSNMKQKFETESRELKETHREELERLENNYKEALKAEKALAEEKLDKMSKEYKYLKSMFHVFQDSIYEEMEDKWLRRKAEWEKDEKMEREKILLQQKCRIIKKFELQSEEKKKKMNESISAVSDNFAREKEELLRQHDEDILQIQELRKSKEILEAELRAQATVLETLNTNLFQCQKELERQKTIAANLEKLFQTKLAEAEEKHKYNIKTPTEENNCLRQMLTTTTYEETSEVSEKSSSASPNMYESDVPEHNSNKKQAS
ncbi:flagellum-associated coiled-coil domain-containing protein 1 isoform X3 [Mus musculus]|nr:flagellum-associated coiled-coil domain-containing protein 1 isoform X3 [Mus musculus]|eukprot:XP_017176714.1 PREDICTED: amyotrophic lateral sclerosis 2 chromosomal region candidate gene 12 protein homolog isoform X3 [Mus musculus]